MTFTLSTPMSQYSRKVDRSRGSAGALLSKAIANAPSASLPPDRGTEILARLSAALGKAKQQDDILVDPDAFGRMLDILELLPPNIPLPQIVVESETEIGLDWENDAPCLSLTFRETQCWFSRLFWA